MSQNLPEEEQVWRLGEMLRSASRITVFTGAGISTESGIPDFRSPGGLWTRFAAIDYQEFIASQEARRRAWRQMIELHAALGDVRPNRGHRAVADLVHRGQCQAVITQNVDGLHQAAGVPDDRVIELHGNNSRALCIDCRLEHELAPILEAFRRDETLPVCRTCGGIVKTATVSFGEAMPEDAMNRAEEASLAADLFLVLGSSLVVYPAAGFPAMAASNGARLAIVNRDPTDQDGLADLVVHDEIGPTLERALHPA